MGRIKMTEFKIVLNALTGEISQVNLTNDEIAQRQIDKTAFLEIQTKLDAAKAANAATKTALLTRLGITEDEARLLLA